VSFVSLLSAPKIIRTAAKRCSTTSRAVLLSKDGVEFEGRKKPKTKNVAKKLQFTSDKPKSRKQTCRQNKGKKPPAFPLDSHAAPVALPLPPNQRCRRAVADNNAA